MTQALYVSTSEYIEEIHVLPVKRQVSVSGILKKLGVSRSGYHAWRKRVPSNTEIRRAVLKEKIHGAWLGRMCGCLLGKPIEGIRTNELHPILKESGNYPMHRYILSSDITEERIATCHFSLAFIRV
jgi:hypothetical protein